MPDNLPSETEGNRIVINVGGKRHETHALTLRNIPDTRLAWLADAHMKSEQQDEVAPKEYFFDRHPDIFGEILNYYRTGKLHSPRDICGPLFEEELQFWGIEEKDMEACCWPYFTQHRDAEKNLNDFVGPEFEESDDDDGEDANSPRDDDNYNVESCWERYQPKIWAFFDDAFSSKKAKVFAYISVFLIVASVISMCAASVGDTGKNVYLIRIEYFFCSWFTLELVVRFIFCPSKKVFLKGILNWVDFISILPYYGQMLFPNSPLGFLRVFRLIRILRIARFFTFTSGLQIIVKSLKASSRELFLLVIILLLPVAIFSSILYEIEKNEKDQPHFNSIPETFWWAIITMTTVGYGDMTPLSIPGRIVGGICALCGVIIVALPVSVIGNNFNTYYTHAQARLSLPKKKRRLIMAGDMNQLARLQGKSASTLGSDPNSDIKRCYSEKTEADEATTRNYRRYHRRSRNTLFAGGGVYIGAVKLGEEYKKEPAEVAENIPIVELNAASLPRNFRLVNTTHESEEYIEHETKRKLLFKMQEDNSSDLRRASTGSCHSKDSDRSRTQSSSELKTAENVIQAPRPRSGKTFRSKVTPSKYHQTEGSLTKSHEIEMAPLHLPAITNHWKKFDNTKPDRPPEDTDGQSSNERTKTENGVFRNERRRNCVSHMTNGHVT